MLGIKLVKNLKKNNIMKLIPMIRFVKKQGNIGMEIQSLTHQQSDRARRFNLIQIYADFLLKEIKKGMFVPCDEFDNILEDPCKHNKYCADFCQGRCQEEYEQAKKQILFKGFEIENYKQGSIYSKVVTDTTGFIHLFWFNKNNQNWEISTGLNNIESLTKLGGIELTETALKEIGLLKTENND